MKQTIIILSLLFITSPLFGQETGVLYRYKTSSGFVWKTFGNDKLQTKFEGEIKGGGPNGQGTFTYLNGNKYVGETMDGTRHGQGTITFSSGDEYIGEWKGGTFNGLGTYTFSDGEKYEGEFKEGTRTGQGTLTLSSGNKYEGEFKDGKPWNGTLFVKNGNIFGKFVNGEWIKN